MDIHQITINGPKPDSYLYGRRAAWFAYAMTIALMLFDFMDRQIIVSMFPFLKAEWSLSDKELGLLVSVISVTAAVFSVPVAWIADRFSRVKSIVVMASIWSIACTASMFTQTYGQLLAARGIVGLGEAGYGPAGTAMVAAHFPQRMRGGLLGGFIASGSVGSVLGVVLGGYVASHWGWKAAFGIVGIPGLVLALLYLLVRDYQTVGVNIGPAERPAPTQSEMIRTILCSRTVRWICTGRRAANRGLGIVVMVAQLPEPRLWHDSGQGRCPGGARRACRRTWQCRTWRGRRLGRNAPSGWQIPSCRSAQHSLNARAGDCVRRSAGRH